jgi:hypothetical protein
MPSEKLAEAIYRDFVFNELSTDIIAAEKSVPVLAVRKAILEYSTGKTFRGSTTFWLVLRVGIPLNLLAFIVLYGLALINDAEPGVYVAITLAGGLTSVFIWAGIHSELVSFSERGLRERITQCLLNSSEEELRTRLKAFEMNSEPQFWLYLDDSQLKKHAFLKKAKIEDL